MDMPVMKKNSRRGMSMASRILLFSSVFLIALPWLGYRYFDEMKDFLLQGQEDAQILAARAVATVLNGRSDLFYPVDQPVDIALEKSALYVYPLEAPVEVDGYASDWGVLEQQARVFGRESAIYDRTGGTGQAVRFNLLLGRYGQYLYALVRVNDSNIVYRDPRYRRLDHSDHVRLEMLAPDGETRRIIFITEGQGQVSVYEMQPDWRMASTGQPVYAISGVWLEHAGGYYLEVRIPESWFGLQPELLFSVANVDNPVERKIDSIVTTMAKGDEGKLNMLVTRTPQLDRILQGLGASDEGICVVDRYRRVRGVYGGDNESTLCSQKDSIGADLVDVALEGQQSVVRRQNASGETLIVAAYPVYANSDILGAVLLEKNSNRILGLQRKSLLQIVIATFIVFVIAIVGLMLFATWLAYRIRKLQRETANAIDSDGRVITEHIESNQFASDEIGQLSRDFSSLLSRLKSYTGFLESVPRTLRHEILNPVNTISMSLQKLEADNDDQPLLVSARKATQQLEMIVHGLTEAAHIDDALSRGDYTQFDLAAMLKEYIENSRLKHGAERFSYSGPSAGVYIRGNDLRIAQLLDKLKDNALDFSPADSEIEFKLACRDDSISLSITNSGPVIPEEILSSLFAGMVSGRSIIDDKPHLGIGLFIANRIAQQHGGELNIANRRDGNGVTVCVNLPLDN
jgi:signal transduction histidine kinase